MSQVIQLIWVCRNKMTRCLSVCALQQHRLHLMMVCGAGHLMLVTFVSAQASVSDLRAARTTARL